MSRYLDDYDAAIDRENPFKPKYKDYMLSVYFASNLTTTLEGTTIDMIYWNPCMAGMTILFTIFGQNIAFGCYEIDILSQLKTLLHIHHALNEIGVDVEDFPILRKLEALFGKSKSIWAVEPKPKRGHFAKHFWLAIGMRPDVATKLAVENIAGIQGIFYSIDQDYALARRR